LLTQEPTAASQDKTALLELLEARRKARGLTMAELAALTGRDPVFVAAALRGQHMLLPEVAEKIATALDVQVTALAPLLECPVRNSDPFKYRLHEMVDVYADALRVLTNEAFGDGILSAIDLKVHFERQGERAVLTIDSKFLPYKQF
jgi:cyanate lyase